MKNKNPAADGSSFSKDPPAAGFLSFKRMPGLKECRDVLSAPLFHHRITSRKFFVSRPFFLPGSCLLSSLLFLLRSVVTALPRHDKLIRYADPVGSELRIESLSLLPLIVIQRTDRVL